MINPNDITVDVEEQREWLLAYKQTINPKTGNPWSWSELERASGISSGTISLFAGAKYGGKDENVALRIFKFRQLLQSQAERGAGIPDEPGFLLTPTAMRLRSLLVMAQRGRITMGCTGPGTSKTFVIQDYKETVANVWVATMQPVTHKLRPMVKAVLMAIGNSAVGNSSWMSDQVQMLVAKKNGVIVIDEANHLDLECLEQLRAWHDATGVGIALFGNEELWAMIRGGKRHHAFARLNSRISMSHLQDLPLREDLEMYLDAWGIEDAGMRKLLVDTGLTPGAGGLREVRQIIENASMLAVDDHQPLSLGHLREAQSTRATRAMRVAI
ncbi:MAG: AAA family ATPase [Sphingorhabdus sp.]